MQEFHDGYVNGTVLPFFHHACMGFSKISLLFQGNSSFTAQATRMLPKLAALAAHQGVHVQCHTSMTHSTTCTFIEEMCAGYLTEWHSMQSMHQYQIPDAPSPFHSFLESFPCLNPHSASLLLHIYSSTGCDIQDKMHANYNNCNSMPYMLHDIVSWLKKGEAMHSAYWTVIYERIPQQSLRALHHLPTATVSLATIPLPPPSTLPISLQQPQQRYHVPCGNGSDGKSELPDFPEVENLLQDQQQAAACTPHLPFNNNNRNSERMFPVPPAHQPPFALHHHITQNENAHMHQISFLNHHPSIRTHDNPGNVYMTAIPPRIPYPISNAPINYHNHNQQQQQQCNNNNEHIVLHNASVDEFGVPLDDDMFLDIARTDDAMRQPLHDIGNTAMDASRGHPVLLPGRNEILATQMHGSNALSTIGDGDGGARGDCYRFGAVELLRTDNGSGNRGGRAGLSGNRMHYSKRKRLSGGVDFRSRRKRFGGAFTTSQQHQW